MLTTLNGKPNHLNVQIWELQVSFQKRFQASSVNLHKEPGKDEFYQFKKNFYQFKKVLQICILHLQEKKLNERW